MPVQFISPSFLWFLGLLAIPVIIHLFNFRRFKRVLFTNVKFLKELKEETNSRSRIKHLLVLLARLLAVAFLVFAFAQPFVPINKNKTTAGESTVSIFLDNSFSMVATGEEGNLLELAKTKAIEVVNAYPPTTSFQFLTNELSGVQQRLLSKEEITEEIYKTKIFSASRSFNDVVARQQEMFGNATEGSRQAFFISDFQKSFFAGAQRNDTTINVNLIAVESNSSSNVYIDSCYLSSPFVRLNETVKVTCLFKNAGDNNVENIPVKLTINGVQKALATVSIAAQGEATAELSFSVTKAGWQRAALSIVDIPVTFDDDYFFSFPVADKIDVYHAGGRTNIFLQTLFNNNQAFNYRFATLQAIDYMQLQNSKTVVVSDVENLTSGFVAELKKFIQNGGTVVLFPDTSVDLSSYNNALIQLGADAFAAISDNADKVDKLDLENPVFNTVFEKADPEMNLPSVSSHYELTTSSRSGRQVLMRMQSGSPFLCEYKNGKGKLFLFTVAANANQSAFVKHALFAPVIARIVFLSAPTGELSYTLGKSSAITFKNSGVLNDRVLHLINKEKSIDIIPEIKTSPEGVTVSLNNEINTSGFYNLQDGDSLLNVLALNYNRSESQLSFYGAADLSNVVKSSQFKSVNIFDGKTPALSKNIAEQNKGISLWKYCIALVLLFLATEIALLRLLR
jgi:Aerotolerance regulator N-terminal